MTTANATSSSDAPSAPDAMLWLIRIVAAIAVVGSAVLAYQSLGDAALPGCAPGSACDKVLSSRWASVMGVPVAIPALGLYVVLLGAAVAAGGRGRGGAWLILAGGGALALASGLWFTGVQIWGVGALCRWCSIVHGAGALLAGLVAFRLATGARVASMPGPGNVVAAAAIGVALAAVTPTLQALGFGAAGPVAQVGPGISYDSGPGPERELRILWGRVPLHPHTLPTIGSPDAEVLLVYLLDYTCGTCREMHGFLNLAREQFGDRLGAVVLPIPLNRDCNPGVQITHPPHRHACDLAELALAVWSVDPDAFQEFDAFLARHGPGSDANRRPEAARARAVELVGEEALDAALATGWAPERLQWNGRLYQAAGGGPVPQVLIGEAWIPGRPPTYQAFLDELAEHTGLDATP